MNSKRRIVFAAVFCFAILPGWGSRTAVAVPILQLYLEGGTYNTTTESWELTPGGSSGGAPFKLWVIGNVSGPGGKGEILDVRLSVSYAAEDEGFGISFTSSTTGGLGGFIDPTLPIDAQWTLAPLTSTDLLPWNLNDGIVTNGSRPVLGDGRSLPTHGVFGSGINWREYYLGDFAETSSPVADFIDDFPTTMSADGGQINVYDVSVTGGSGVTLHFDTYDHIEGANSAKFAPFSHDADGDVNVIPEPASLIVWSLLCTLGLAIAAWRRRRVM